ncbi:MAG: LapA family protein [Nitrospirae bacterium]|nr:LapA family protein [Nitrospirota bacterium]
MNFLFSKKVFLPLLSVAFLFAVFLDENYVPVPLKFFFGGPFHLHLSAIIIVSMMVGAIITLLSVFIFNNIRSKLKKMKVEKNIEMKRI